MFWIITAYLVCWLPYLVTRVLWVILSKPTSAVSTNIGMLSLQLSVIIDPVLNLVFRKDLRTTIERLLRKQRTGSMTIQTGAFNLGFSRVVDRESRPNTRIFVRPKSENVVDWVDNPTWSWRRIPVPILQVHKFHSPSGYFAPILFLFPFSIVFWLPIPSGWNAIFQQK